MHILSKGEGLSFVYLGAFHLIIIICVHSSVHMTRFFGQYDTLKTACSLDLRSMLLTVEPGMSATVIGRYIKHGLETTRSYCFKAGFSGVCTLLCYPRSARLQCFTKTSRAILTHI